MECEVFICLSGRHSGFLKHSQTSKENIHTYIQMGTHVLQLQWKKGEQVFVVQPTIRNLIEEKIIGVESIEANGFQVSTLKKP
jgi:recombinational DNA repair protein (RecF pathway)